MIQQAEIAALETRAHAARISMRQVCVKAGLFPQSWYRARKRGSMEYDPYNRLEGVLLRLEADRASPEPPTPTPEKACVA